MADRVGVGAVWNSAAEVLSGRAGPMLSVAFLTAVLPPAAQSVLRVVLAPAATTNPAAGLVLVAAAIAVLLVSLWGTLVLLGLASDPSVDGAAARRAATSRLPASLGVVLAVVVAVLLLLIPVSAALAAAGVDATVLMRGAGAGTLNVPPGTALFVSLYLLALGVAMLWLGARLMPLQAVILHERRGLGAIARSFALTRGMGFRLVAVLLLFGVVVLVATVAVQAVATVVLTLILGQGVTSAVIVAVLAATVSAALAVPAYAFVARLYAALTARAARP